MPIPEEFSLTDEQDASAISTFLEERLYEHNAAAAGRDDGRLFARTVRDHDRVVAGIAGWTWADACEITQLWVSDEVRGRGWGARLIREAENEARSRRCRVVLVKTYGFQAPSFYERHGYHVVQVVDDFPPGHRYYTLTKRL